MKENSFGYLHHGIIWKSSLIKRVEVLKVQILTHGYKPYDAK